MLGLYKCFNNETDRAAHKYRVAWHALSTLDPGGSWSEQLKELKAKDVSGPGRDPDDSTTSNSRYQPSWIWLVQDVAQSSRSGSELHIDEDEFNENMLVEWAKARARMMRWKEEWMLVQEEMRRVIAYHKWKADWWRGRSSKRSNADLVILSWISGYAHKQADMCTRMAERCALYWLPHLKSQGGGIMPSWGLEYEHLLVEVGREACDTTPGIDGTEDLNGDGNEMEGEDEDEIGENKYFELDDLECLVDWNNFFQA
jgi:hypothetical protein